MKNKIGHALLSPSSSERWLNCTPSAFLESFEPTQPSNVYAEEGTEAHALSEIKLSYMLGKISDEEYNTKFENFLITSKFYNNEFNEFVNSYCNEVLTIVKEDYKGQELIVELEQKVEFSDVVPDGSGTSDVIIIGKTFVHVIDLKFGKGVPVSAIDNTQLRLYALGALKKYRLNGVFTEAKMTICQPRLNDISTDFVSVSDLNKWAIEYVKPRALLAIEGKGELSPGDHCKFCKRRGKCEALGTQQLATAQREFDTIVVEENIVEPHNMTPEMLSRILFIAPKFIDWFNSIKSYTMAAMINDGLKVPGYKIVEGRSDRVITNPDGIATALSNAGFVPGTYLTEPKLLGITALEKNIGKKLFNELCGEYIIKPIGRPTVVPETDKRVSIDAAQLRLVGQEFDLVENENEE